MDKLTDGGRVLTREEQVLADYLGNGRQAIALAPYADLSRVFESVAEHRCHFLAQAVMRAMICIYEARHGKIDIEYCGGQRRDTLRG